MSNATFTQWPHLASPANDTWIPYVPWCLEAGPHLCAFLIQNVNFDLRPTSQIQRRHCTIYLTGLPKCPGHKKKERRTPWTRQGGAVTTEWHVGSWTGWQNRKRTWVEKLLEFQQGLQYCTTLINAINMLTPCTLIPWLWELDKDLYKAHRRQ